MNCRVEEVESWSLTSVEDPKRDELDLDDGRDDTHPTSNENKGQRPGRESRVIAKANTYIANIRYCRSLIL